MANVQAFKFDADDFYSFSRALAKATPGVRLKMRRGIREGAAIMTADLKKNLPFQDTAGAAKRGVRVSFAKSVGGAAVVVGGRSTPQSWAFAFLLGNRGLGTLRHPVYGNRKVWANQPIEPKAPAIIARDAIIVADAVRFAVMETLEEVTIVTDTHG